MANIKVDAHANYFLPVSCLKILPTNSGKDCFAKNHFQGFKGQNHGCLLVHRVWVRLGPDSNHLFSCLFVARVGRNLEVASLFGFLFFLFYSIKMKQSGQRKCCGVGPKCCVRNFLLWLVSAQINDGVVKVSTASAFTAKVLLGACLPQHPATATAHLGVKAQATPGATLLWDKLGVPRVHHGDTVLVVRYRILLQCVKCTVLPTLSLLS